MDVRYSRERGPVPRGFSAGQVGPCRLRVSSNEPPIFGFAQMRDSQLDGEDQLEFSVVGCQEPVREPLRILAEETTDVGADVPSQPEEPKERSQGITGSATIGGLKDPYAHFNCASNEKPEDSLKHDGWLQDSFGEVFFGGRSPSSSQTKRQNLGTRRKNSVSSGGTGSGSPSVPKSKPELKMQTSFSGIINFSGSKSLTTQFSNPSALQPLTLHFPEPETREPFSPSRPESGSEELRELMELKEEFSEAVDQEVGLSKEGLTHTRLNRSQAVAVLQRLDLISSAPSVDELVSLELLWPSLEQGRSPGFSALALLSFLERQLGLIWSTRRSVRLERGQTRQPKNKVLSSTDQQRLLSKTDSLVQIRNLVSQRDTLPRSGPFDLESCVRKAELYLPRNDPHSTLRPRFDRSEWGNREQLSLNLSMKNRPLGELLISRNDLPRVEQILNEVSSRLQLEPRHRAVLKAQILTFFHA